MSPPGSSAGADGADGITGAAWAIATSCGGAEVSAYKSSPDAAAAAAPPPPPPPRWRTSTKPSLALAPPLCVLLLLLKLCRLCTKRRRLSKR